jgi:hypothetical protein
LISGAIASRLMALPLFVLVWLKPDAVSAVFLVGAFGPLAVAFFLAAYRAASRSGPPLLVMRRSRSLFHPAALWSSGCWRRVTRRSGHMD